MVIPRCRGSLQATADPGRLDLLQLPGGQGHGVSGLKEGESPLWPPVLSCDWGVEQLKLPMTLPFFNIGHGERWAFGLEFQPRAEDKPFDSALSPLHESTCKSHTSSAGERKHFMLHCVLCGPYGLNHALSLKKKSPLIFLCQLCRGSQHLTWTNIQKNVCDPTFYNMWSLARFHLWDWLCGGGGGIT